MKKIKTLTNLDRVVTVCLLPMGLVSADEAESEWSTRKISLNSPVLK